VPLTSCCCFVRWFVVVRIRQSLMVSSYLTTATTVKIWANY
jgi:hypothetical protein